MSFAMAHGPPTRDGCYILTLADGRMLAGVVEVVPAAAGVVARLEVQTYATGAGGNRAFTATLSPESVHSHVPCNETEARALTAALTGADTIGRAKVHADEPRDRDTRERPMVG